MPSSGCKKCARSEEHTSELQSHDNLVCRLLLEKKHMDPRSGPSCTAPRRPRVAHALIVRRVVVREGGVRGGRRGRDQGGVRLRLSFFFNNRAPPESYPLPQPAALPI